MPAKKLTIETKIEKFYFKIEEVKGKYILNKVTPYRSWGSTLESFSKIGETRSVEEAITLAKVSISGEIINISLDSY